MGGATKNISWMSQLLNNWKWAMEHLLNYYVIIKLVNNLVIHAKTKQMKIKHHYPILYIKANVVSVYVDKNWAVLGRFFQSLPIPCGVGNKQGRAEQGSQGSHFGGLREVPFLLKKSLGKTGGPASNQTKIQFFLKIIFIIEHIKKSKIFF